jgi:hypothetical protein
VESWILFWELEYVSIKRFESGRTAFSLDSIGVSVLGCRTPAKTGPEDCWFSGYGVSNKIKYVKIPLSWIIQYSMSVAEFLQPTLVGFLQIALVEQWKMQPDEVDAKH